MKKQNIKIVKTTFATIIAAVLLLAGFSCKKEDVDKFTTIGFSYSYDVDVPATAITDSLKTEAEYLSPLIDSKSAEKIKDAKTTADLVSEIKMTKFTVTCIGGTSNLDYVNSIKVYIKSAKNSEVLLMEKTNIPAGAKSVDMDLKDVNIKEFIFEDQIQFRTGLSFKQTKAIDDQKMRLDATLLGKAKLPS
jgi:hypothetical protein